MILKKRQPKEFDKDKYYVDMNELQHKSRSRLYFIFGYIVQKELNWSDEQVYDMLQEFGNRVEFDALIKAMNEHIKDLIVFYYGKGDDATEYSHDVNPNKGMPKSKAVRKPRKKRVNEDGKTTQELFEERMREQVKKELDLDGSRAKEKKRAARARRKAKMKG